MGVGPKNSIELRGFEAPCNQYLTGQIQVEWSNGGSIMRFN